MGHWRGKVLWHYIRAGWGLSDAANLLLFCSGRAASSAFGGPFLRQGLLMGTARIVHRCWQLLIAHLGLFFTVAMVVIAGTRWFGDTDYVEVLSLQRFFADTPGSLIGLFTLTYVPHYFDILPVYIVVLAMVPVAMLLARINALLVPAASVVLYIAAVRLGLNFPANADDQAEWYFNPFAWQLIFFTGFSLGRGWVSVPLDSKPLLWGSILVLVVGLAMSLPVVFTHVMWIDTLRIWIMEHSDKTNLDLLQYVHFLASVYVAVVILKGRETILLTPLLRPFVKCGQQALAVFLSGMVLSHIGGMIFAHARDGAGGAVPGSGAPFSAPLAIAFSRALVHATARD